MGGVMRSQSTKTYRASHVPALAGLVLVSGFATAHEVVERPKWNLGDSWSYTRNSYSTSRTTSTVKLEYELFVSSTSDPTYSLLYSSVVDGKSQRNNQTWSKDTNYMNRGGDGGKWQEYGWYKWPLAEGNTWTASWKFPTTDESECQVKAQGWETVTVPAGTFDALRINFSCGYFYHGVDSGNGRTTDVVWYSPLVKRHVRMQRKNFRGPYVGNDDLEELTAYRVQ
jgi:hypothetical protein